MLDIITNAINEAFIDSIKLFPFLLATYLMLEYLEHKTGDKTKQIIGKSDKIGPLAGAALGLLPQCGFSAVASNFYAARIITLGTLIAVYLSTSDEMLPIMISSGVDAIVIAKILAIKFAVGMTAGFAIDAAYKPSEHKIQIHDLCEHEGCNCGKDGILKSSVKHAVQITVFIFIINFILNLIIHYIGWDAVKVLFLGHPVVGEIIAGIIGLIPNCVASVIITEFYLDGAINTGALMSGLLVGSGVGTLVLFKVNRNLKQNLKIVALLYIIGVISGIIINLCGLTLY